MRIATASLITVPAAIRDWRLDAIFSIASPSTPYPCRGGMDTASPLSSRTWKGRGVRIDSACRAGWCGTCMVKLNAGKVLIAVEEALGEDDMADGYILACQAEPVGDIELGG